MPSLSPILPTLDPRFGAIKQIAFVVSDLDEAMREWNDKGVSHFLVCRKVPALINAEYRGAKLGNIEVEIAFAYLGDLQLELIFQNNTTPSMYTEGKHHRPGKPHHYAVCVDDYPAMLAASEELGFSPVLQCGIEGMARMSYLESKTEPELMLEVIEANELTAPYFQPLYERWANANPNQLQHELNLHSLTPKAAVVKRLSKLMWSKITGRNK